MFITAFLNSQNEEIELWKDTIPYSIKSIDYQETYEYENNMVNRISKVTTPTLTTFIPENPNGTAVVICPGGGYAYLSINKEGYKVAEWLNTLGITAFVLKYRLPSDEIMEQKSVGPLQDAQEAMRFIRRNAQRWQVKTDKIGVLGFSAGGHLASTLATQYNDKVYEVNDSVSAKPSFAVLIYPVISMDDQIVHKGSRKRLLGDNPSNELKDKFSNDKRIDSLTSPTFLVHATDDKSVPVENSIFYYMSLKQHNISSEFHIYQDGKHGFGLGLKGTNEYWTKQCENWLRINKYIN
jgi:acetyl esterase/lipase